MRGTVRALASLLAGPLARRLSGYERVDLTYDEKREFIRELEADEAFERAIFARGVLITLAITGLIAARIIFV